ncbi:thioredoxin family protein [Dryocola clanedunensis]
MSKSVTFYHAGCPVCLSAEHSILQIIDPTVSIDIVHLGDSPDQIAVAEASGVKSVPALVIDGQVLHLNFGASIADLK